MAEPAGVWPLLFEAQGADEVKAKAQGVVNVLEGFAAIGDNALKGFSGALTGLRQPLEGFAVVLGKVRSVMPDLTTSFKALGALGNAVGNAFVGATSSLTSWVTMGIQGTGQGQQLAFWIQRLSFEIAGLFTPAIEKAIDMFRGMAHAVGEFSNSQAAAARNLAVMGLGLAGLASGGLSISKVFVLMSLSSEDGRAKMIELAKAFTAFGMEAGKSLMPVIQGIGDILIPIIDALTAVLKTSAGQWLLFSGVALVAITKIASAVAALNAALGIANILSNPLRGALVVGGALAAGAAVYGATRAYGSRVGREGDAASEDRHRRLTVAPAGFEDMQGLFHRLQTAATKVDYDRQTADYTRQTAEGVQRLYTQAEWLQRRPNALAVPGQ